MDLHQYEDRLGLSPCYVLTPLCFPNVSSRVLSCIFLFADFWDSKAFQSILVIDLGMRLKHQLSYKPEWKAWKRKT